LNEGIKWRVFISLLVSLSITLFIFRTSLFTPGILEFGDFVFHLDLEWVQTRFLSTWNPYFSSDNGSDISIAPWLVWTLFVQNSEIMTKVLLFGSSMVLTSSAFLVTFSLTENIIKKSNQRYISASLSSIFVIFNPFIVVHISHYTYLWGTAAMFVVLYFVTRAMNAQNWRTCANYSLLGAIPFTLSAVTSSFYSVLYTFLLVFLILCFTLLFSKIPIRLRLQNLLIFLSLTGIFSFFLVAYWFVPAWFGNLLSIFESGPQWMPVRTVSLLTPIWTHSDILNSFRLATPWNVGVEFFTGNTIPPLIWTLSTFILPIFVLTAILLRSKEIIVKQLLGIAIISIGLTSLPHNILRESYLSFLENAGLFAFPFDIPDLLQSFLIISYTILGAIFIGTILEKIDLNNKIITPYKKILGSLFIAMVIVSSSVNAYPLLSGNVENYFQPINIPPEYENMREWLASQDGDFRVLIYPGIPHVPWMPHRLSTDMNRWISTQPVFIPTGQTYDTPLHNMIFHLIKNGHVTNLGKVLTLANIRYIVYHDDMNIIYSHLGSIDTFYSQKDLKVVFTDESITIFENTEWTDNYIYAVSRANIVIGGIDSVLPLIDLENFHPTDSAMIFLEQKAYSIEELHEITQVDTTFIFHGKDFDDLVLNTVGPDYHYAPYEHVPRRIIDWNGNTVNVPWIGLYGIVDPLIPAEYGGRGEFDLGRGFVWSNMNNASFDFKITVSHEDNYEFWVRLFRSFGGGDLSFYIDNEKISTVNTVGPGGFKWVQINTTSLDKGIHSISIVNDNGLNVVNLIALPPSDLIASHEKELSIILQKENVDILMVNTDQYVKSAATTQIYVSNSDIIDSWSSEYGSVKDGLLFILSTNQTETKGTWEVSNGTLVSKGDHAYQFIGTSETFSEIEFGAKLFINNTASFLAFRTQDMVNTYMFGVEPWSNFSSLIKIVNGQETVLGRIQLPSVKNQWLSLHVIVIGDQINCYLNDNVVISVADNTFSEGRVGLWVYNVENGYFRDIAMKSEKFFDIHVPVDSNYVLAFTGLGNLTLPETISINNQYYIGPQEENWRYFGPIMMSSNESILHSQSAISRLFMYTSDSSNQTMNDFIKSDKYPVKLHGEIENPTKLQFDVNISKPSIIIFPERFYTLWDAISENERLSNLIVFSAYNGFLLSQPGSHEIQLTFSPEDYYRLGITISGLTLILLITTIIILNKEMIRNTNSFRKYNKITRNMKSKSK